MTVGDILQQLEAIAPARFAFSFDHVGLQVGARSSAVTKAVVSLDRSMAAAQLAVSQKAQLLLCHHPLIWDPMAAITDDSYAGRTALFLIQNGINFIAAHTNWDCAMGGVNDTLASLLELQNVRPFGSAPNSQQLKLVVFAPQGDVRKIIDAASSAGAGTIGLYTRCAFIHPGTGTYYSGEGTDPTVGKVGEVTETPEVRIEMVLPLSAHAAVAEAVRKAHSYEEPALDFLRTTDFEEMPISRIGELRSSVPLAEFVQTVDKVLATRCLAWGSGQITSVAVCGGAAADEWKAAQAAGADVLVTGEVPQHMALEASESGFSIIAAGHYATEHPGCVALANAMRERAKDVEWVVFEPAPGMAGRPL